MALADNSRWHIEWREFWRKRKPRATCHNCIHLQDLWHRFRRRSPAVLLEDSRYCLNQCLESALAEKFQRQRSFAEPGTFLHRVPLGLLLLSRQQLAAEQLQTALETQRKAGHGKIGHWLQTLGFVNEQQITAALARQWSCPVLRINSSFSFRPTFKFAHVPLVLLQEFSMIPLDYISSTATLHIAFGEIIDHCVLYAIEQMIPCRTEPCLAVPSFVRANLQWLASNCGNRDVVFEHVTDTAEISRIIRSYCTRLEASEIRIADCRSYLWVRLLRPPRPSIDLFLRIPQSGLHTLSPALLPGA